MSTPPPTRLETELSLLQAMYPSQTTYSPTSRELKFTTISTSTSTSTPEKATLLLRLPDTYPSSSLPAVISATNASKTDLRNDVVHAIKDMHFQEGEECLDILISTFQDIVSRDNTHVTLNHPNSPEVNEKEKQSKTVIIWLHHLLSTTKRKLSLSPPSPHVCGLSKPGYPGILIFSGPAPCVDEHVAVLKAQNWAAFQVRYEEFEEWRFAHGEGVREVESMSGVVGGGECGGERREVLLRAVGIK